MRPAEWQERAVCLTTDPERWTAPTVPRDLARLCRACPVSDLCLEAAMEAEKRAGADSRYGVFGGLGPRERHALYLDRERAARKTDGA